MSFRLGLTSPAFVSVAGGGSGSAGAIITGTMQPQYAGGSVYVGAAGYGVCTSDPFEALSYGEYISFNGWTSFYFPNGTHGTLVTDTSGINGIRDISLTIGSTTLTGTLADNLGAQVLRFTTGDVFNLIGLAGTTVSYSVSFA